MKRPWTWLGWLALGALGASGCAMAHADDPPAGDRKPTLAEWHEAPVAEEIRVTDPGCKAKRLRDWYRVECSSSAVSLVAGERRDLDLVAFRDDFRAWVVFRARRGDRRVVVFERMNRWGFAPDTVVSEQWLDDEPAPVIGVLGVL